MQTRKEIRKHIASKLIGKTSAGQKVNVNNQEFDEPFPYIMVSTPLDQSINMDSSVRATEHKLSCVIDMVDQGHISEIYDKLDDLADEVEAEIENKFKGQLNTFTLVKTQTEAIEKGEETTGFLRLTYDCQYIKKGGYHGYAD